MNPFESVEAWCANVVERAFARLFPSVLEPAQIARRLVAIIERSPPPADADAPSRYTVRVSPGDFASLEHERELLERQWTKMAEALCERAAIAAPRPVIRLVADPELHNGAIAIDVAHGPAFEDRPLQLRVERGLSAGNVYPIPAGEHAVESLVIGRDARCDVVIADPRASRRHVRLTAHDGGVAFEDLGSTNGTLRNGNLEIRGPLRVGDRLQVGDTRLVLEAVDAA